MTNDISYRCTSSPIVKDYTDDDKTWLKLAEETNIPGGIDVTIKFDV